MPVLYLKSLLSLLLALFALINMYTMYEFFGRKEKKFNGSTLKKVHRISGYLFLAVFLVIAYLCLDLLATSRMALNSRLMFHAVLALAVLLLLLTKIAYVRVYTLFYARAKNIGPVIGMLAIGLVAISGGYYLLVTGFGTKAEAAHSHEQEHQDEDGHRNSHGENSGPGVALLTDKESIARGKSLYRENCIYCHDPQGVEKKMGPGHKNILSRDTLPVSGRPATPENIARQIRDPYQNMPAFPDLTDKEVANLLAYLNTL